MERKYYTRRDFKTSNWSAGKTYELLIVPENASYAKRDFALRISSATIDLPCSKFTYLNEIKRFITPLSNSILLECDDNEPILLTPFEVFEFNGNEKTLSYGMAQDFNLMLNKNKMKGWMKTSRCSKRLEISVKKDSTIWFFNYIGNNRIIINLKEYEMEPFSLITIKHFQDELISVDIEKDSPVIYGYFIAS